VSRVANGRLGGAGWAGCGVGEGGRGEKAVDDRHSRGETRGFREVSRMLIRGDAVARRKDEGDEIITGELRTSAPLRFFFISIVREVHS
jgi:hypothetical protein